MGGGGLLSGLNSGFSLPQIKTLPEMLKESQQEELANAFYKRLIQYVQDFEKELDQEHEVAVRLVNFGQNTEFIVTGIGYYDPKLISFYGVLQDGSRVQLIQHVNQLSFLLLAAPRKNPVEPKRQIGFCANLELGLINETACSQAE